MKSKPVKNHQGKNSAKAIHHPAGKEPGAIGNVLRNQPLLVLFFLAATFLCYLPSLTSDFIPTWDDKAYVIDNVLIRSLSFETIKSMFTTQVGGTYVPLPLLSYAIEYKLWGLNPLPFHITNVLLHLLATFLVFRIICQLQLKVLFAAAAALVYGIHPMGVESVAWVTERKDLLYCVFYFGSFLLYIYYVQAKSYKTILFLSSLSVFILALFSKIQAVSLPLVLFLVDYYFNRKGLVRLVLEKTPFFLLSLVFGIAGIYVLQSVGALKINEFFTFTERFFLGIYALSAYVVKFIAPGTMSALYPYPVSTGNPLPLIYYLSPVFIILIGITIYYFARKTKAIVFGSLFFFLSIVFMLQIFGAGQGFMADRYVKVPYLGLVFIAGWGMEYIQGKYKSRIVFMWLGFFVYCLFLMVSSYQRGQVWKNGGALWTDVIEKYPVRDARPYACRGLYYRAEKDNDRALADLRISLALEKDPEIMLMRGNIYFEMGKDDSAYMDYISVLKVKMDNALALSNIGAIYVKRNQFDSAVYCLGKSIMLDSGSAVSYANRAVAYGALGKTDESIADFKRYLAIKPDDERVFVSIAIACQRLGRFQESIEWLDKAIARKPDFGSYYYFRSQSFKMIGDREKALDDGLKAAGLGVKVPPEYLQSLR